MGAAHVAVGCGFGVDGVEEFEALDEHARTHIKNLGNALGDFSIAELFASGIAHMGCTVGVDVKSDRFSDPNGIGHLDQNLVAKAGGHHVLGNVAGCISGRAVHFGGVFARKGTATVGAFATVGVHNDLAAGEAGIPVGSANHKIPGGVDVVFNGFVQKAANPRWELALNAG